MRVEVDISAADFRALVRLAQRLARSGSYAPRAGLSSWIFIVGGGVVAGLLFVLVKEAARLPFHWPTAAGVALLFIALTVAFNARAQRRIGPRPDGCILGRHVDTLTEDGIREESAHTEGIVRWSGVQSVQESPEHLFVMLDATAGYVLPKRYLIATPSADDVKRFVTAHLPQRG